MTDAKRCNATVMGKRCDFTGTRDELRQHADETTHTLCRICQTSLANSEPTVCSKCVQWTRDNLHLIVDACTRMPSTAESAGYRNEPIPGGVSMIILAGGSIEGGGPDDHIDFHDPIDPLAVLEHNERDWRITFGHGRGDGQATIENCAAYLLTWLQLAARNHPAFDEFAGEMRVLAIRLTHTVGVANDPERATAKCIDCGGVLISPYRGGVDFPEGVTRQGLPWEGREMTGTDDEPEPVWECRGCQMIYTPIEYRLAVRTHIEARSELAG